MHLSFMTWVCPTWDLDRIADFVADSAYGGVEFRTDVGHAHRLSADSSAAERAAALELLDDRGVDVAAVATGAGLARSDPDERAAEVAATKAEMDLAADLGADVVRVFAKGDREEMTDGAAADAAAALDELGEYGADLGVTPLLETMHDIVQSPADAYAVLDRVQSENVALLWNRASITPEEFAAVRDDVRHVHMHDEALDPDFEGTAEMFERFADAGYDGYFSLEIIRDEDLPEAQLRDTGERLRGYVEDAA